MDGEGRMRTETEFFTVNNVEDALVLHGRIRYREDEGCAVRDIVSIGAKAVLVVFEETCLPGPAFTGTGEEI